MDIEGMLILGTAILIDLLVLAYAGKWLVAKWKEMKADGKITVDEVLDAAEEVVEMVKETIDKLEGEEE
tara:strand:- start:1963 stop:2169 length:207 start_codon:yes stop_codon:yes gene_type:complete